MGLLQLLISKMNTESESDYPWGLIVISGIVIVTWIFDKWRQYDDAVYAARYKNMRDHYGNIGLI